MPSTRRKFSITEKKAILEEALQAGITPVLKKYNLSYSVFYRWKQQAEQDNESGKHRAPSREELKKIMEENAMLKKMVVNLALELEMKNETLNKSGDHHKK
jgi:putative transposase